MRISKSKQELARIISENGGWIDGAESAAQSKSDNDISFYCDTAHRDGDCWWGSHITRGDIAQSLLLPNWHQTILSRDEYFHLYPASDAKPEYCKSVMRSIPEPSDKPTIEQLAADYRNLLDFARRKQEEADDAKADADEALRKLELAGEAIGLVVTPIAAKKESELVITDWRDLRVGDVIQCVGDAWNDDFEGREAVVTEIGDHDYEGEYRILARIGEESDWGCDFIFIRRP